VHVNATVLGVVLLVIAAGGGLALWVATVRRGK
jgi:hypothetical protein